MNKFALALGMFISAFAASAAICPEALITFIKAKK